MLAGCCVADRAACVAQLPSRKVRRESRMGWGTAPPALPRGLGLPKTHGSQPSRPGRLRSLVSPVWDIFPIAKGTEGFLKELGKNWAGVGGELQSRGEPLACLGASSPKCDEMRPRHLCQLSSLTQDPGGERSDWSDWKTADYKQEFSLKSTSSPEKSAVALQQRSSAQGCRIHAEFLI